MGTAPSIFINKEPFAASGICQLGTFGWPRVFVNQELWLPLEFINQEYWVGHVYFSTRNILVVQGYLSTRNLWLSTGI